MTLLITATLVLAALWVMANLRAPYPAVPLLIALLFMGVSLHTGISLLLLIPGGIVALLLFFLGVRSVRMHFITKPLLTQFRRVLPPMSTTEQEALDAGTIWWDAELFRGKPRWNKLLDMEPAELTPQEQAYLDGPVEELCKLIDDWQITHHDKTIPREIWRFICESRMFGMIIPKEYGGLEFSALAHSQVVMKIASKSITAAVTMMVPNSLGPAKLLLHYGTEEQKQYYLPRLANGEEIPCFALTGPDAGSDATAMPDKGVICHGEFEGERILGIRLNWSKRYITLGPVATLLGLAFKLEDPSHLLGERDDLGITVALIPTDTPGIEIGNRHITLDIPFQNGPNCGRDVFIPLDWVIGGEEGIGRGWQMLVESLAEGRGISLPALATGAGKMASRYTGAYARVRRQFNLPIGYFEGVEEPLARIAALTYQMDAARLFTLQAIDQGEKPSVISAIIKYHLTERYRQVINDAMDIHGGSGICLGPSNLVGRAYQAVPISITVEGANILTRSMIIFGQGAIRCHPYILKEIEAAYNPDREAAVEAFDSTLFRHIAFLIGNSARSLLLGLARGRFSYAPARDSKTRRHFQHLNWMCSAFALSADVAMMTLGGSLKRKERLSARLADVLSELYLSSAVLKHYQVQGAHEADLALVNWTVEDSLYRMQEALRSLFHNLPFPPLGWVLRLIIFPTGMPFSVPDDSAGHAAARTILSSSGVRDRLTEGIYTTSEMDDPRGVLERALEQAEAVKDIEGVLRAAQRNRLIRGDTQEALLRDAVAEGILSQQQVEAMQTMDCLRDKAIQVDAFEDYGKAPRAQVGVASNDKNIYAV
ncbi:MAG: acyl-CoA dehydrogenase [Chromatiales bacterium]|nr:acyl-CoA dehydrogenase [Chromatiales bacterium]